MYLLTVPDTTQVWLYRDWVVDEVVIVLTVPDLTQVWLCRDWVVDEVVIVLTVPDTTQVWLSRDGVVVEVEVDECGQEGQQCYGKHDSQAEAFLNTV